MDIYLLRDGKEFGPYSEEATQSFLKQGSISMDDLAWSPGLPSWSPLTQVLYPAQRKMEPEPEPAPAHADYVYDPAVAHEPATNKQKAFLSYIGVAFTAETTKEQAAVLVNEAMEDPRQSTRVAQWNEDRLRLHPEIFAEEVQARREDRANRHFDACEHEGAAYFTGVTKAHCQVLVGYLDVNYPGWDAHEADSAKNYFFPAIAEKFPQVVNKEFRGQLNFPVGARRAANGRAGATTAPIAAPSPLGALIHGGVVGLGLLLALYVGMQMFTQDEVPELEPAVPKAKAGPLLPAASAETPKTAEAPHSEPAKKPRKTAPDPEPEMASTPAPAPATTPDPMPTDPEPAAPAAPRTHVTIRKPTDVKTPFGKATLPVGTQLKIVSHDATRVIVIYGGQQVALPLDSTDLPPASPPP